MLLYFTVYLHAMYFVVSFVSSFLSLSRVFSFGRRFRSGQLILPFVNVKGNKVADSQSVRMISTLFSSYRIISSFRFDIFTVLSALASSSITDIVPHLVPRAGVKASS